MCICAQPDLSLLCSHWESTDPNKSWKRKTHTPTNLHGCAGRFQSWLYAVPFLATRPKDSIVLAPNIINSIGPELICCSDWKRNLRSHDFIRKSKNGMSVKFQLWYPQTLNWGHIETGPVGVRLREAFLGIWYMLKHPCCFSQARPNWCNVCPVIGKKCNSYQKVVFPLSSKE